MHGPQVHLHAAASRCAIGGSDGDHVLERRGVEIATRREETEEQKGKVRGKREEETQRGALATRNPMPSNALPGEPLKR